MHKQDPGFTLVLRRNCSLSPGELLGLLALPLVVSGGIGALCAAEGAWLVMPFAGVELAAVAAAFCLQARHALDYERIDFARGRLVVEVLDGQDLQRSELNAACVRVAERESARDYHVALSAHGREIAVGRHLDGARRRALAGRLKDLIQAEEPQNDDPQNG